MTVILLHTLASIPSINPVSTTNYRMGLLAWQRFFKKRRNKEITHHMPMYSIIEMLILAMVSLHLNDDNRRREGN